jgi:hypothetical protein
MSNRGIFSGWSGLTRHKVNVQQQISDLMSKADYLRQALGLEPQIWHEFKGDENALNKYRSSTDFSADGLAIGSALGIIAGAAASAAAITVLGIDPGAMLVLPAGVIGGGVLGGALGGAHYRSGADAQHEYAEAYAKYLDDFERRYSPALGTRPTLLENPPVSCQSVPRRRRLDQPTLGR